MSDDVEAVVIGASLGGLNALGVVLGELEPARALPVLVAQHRRADGGEALAKLVGKRTRLPVVEPDDGEKIRPGHVYLAPAGYHLLVERERCALSVEAPVSYSRPSIDVLFESAADSYDGAVAGLLLTGASADGAVGLQTIQRSGGATAVQDPAEAEAPAAPLAALARMRPDRVLRLHEMGAWIRGFEAKAA